MAEVVFNPATDRVIGRVNRLLKKDSASIEVLGIVSNEDEVLKPSLYSRKEIFPNKGLVFAPSFHNHSMVKDPLKIDNIVFSFYCYEEPVDDPEKDLMKVDYERQLNALVPVLVKETIEGFINLEELYEQVDFPAEIASLYVYDSSNEILYVKLMHHPGRIVPFKRKRLSGYRFSKEVFARNSFKSGDTTYLYTSENFVSQNIASTVDCMNSDQLAKWYVNKVKDLVSCDDLAIGTLKKSLEVALSDDDELTPIRISRIRNKLDQFELDVESINEMLSGSSVIGQQFATLWNDNEENLKNNLINEHSEIFQQKIDEIKAQEIAITALAEEKSKISAEIVTMEDEMTSLEQKINMLEDHQDSLVQIAASSAQALLNSQDESHKGLSRTVSPTKKVEFFEVNNGDIPFAESKKDVKTYLNEYEGMNLGSLLPSIASFIPDLSVAYFLAYKLNKTKLLHINVEPTWFSYDDLAERGVTEFWDACFNEPEYNYILLLDNINAGICDAYAKPLLDVISEKRVLLPYSSVKKRKLPRNLFVLATLAPIREGLKIGLPLNRDLFLLWDCLTCLDGTEFSIRRIDVHSEIFVSPSDYVDIRKKGVPQDTLKGRVDEHYRDFFGKQN